MYMEHDFICIYVIIYIYIYNRYLYIYILYLYIYILYIYSLNWCTVMLQYIQCIQRFAYSIIIYYITQVSELP